MICEFSVHILGPYSIRKCCTSVESTSYDTKKTVDQMEALKAIQLCGAHWVCGSQYSRTRAIFSWNRSTVQCCSELKWPPLSIRRHCISLSLLYIKYLHNCSCFDFLKYISSSCTRSHSLSLHCRQSNINFYS